MKSIVAKFDCWSVEPQGEGDEKQVHVHMQASMNGDDNKEWAFYTPSGMLDLNINANVPAANVCEPGKSYKVTIEEIEE